MAHDLSKPQESEDPVRADDGEQKSRIPTYPKMSKEYLSEETLQHFQLPYRTDSYDENYFIVFREMDVYETDLLFEHTRRLRTMRATSIELDERQYSVSPIHGEAALPPSEGPSVQPNGSRKTVSSEQNTTPKSIIRRRWDRSCSAPTEIPKRTDSLSPELGPPLTFKIRKKHLNTAADVDIATSKTPPPRAVSAPRYSNMRVYVRDVEEESLRFFEIPYSWHPDEPDCFTLLRDMSDADMEAVFRYTKKLRATSNRSGDGVSQPAREQLAALKKTLDETVWPQCEALKTSPPTDVEARQEEYDLMSQLLVREMVFSVSSVEAGEDNQAKMDKVELLMECHRIMQALDEIIRQR